MFYEGSSIFGSLQSTISASMSMSVYSTAQVANIGSLNVTLGDFNESKIGKNKNIVCGQYTCNEDDNDFYCN